MNYFFTCKDCTLYQTAVRMINNLPGLFACKKSVSTAKRNRLIKLFYQPDSGLSISAY